MKTIIRLALLIAISVLASLSVQAQSASIDKVWLEHDVTQNGEKGINIHVKFSVKGMLNQRGRCAAWFFYDNKAPIEGVTSRDYATPSGKLTTLENFTPQYEHATFNDLVLFLPFSVLKRASNRTGSYDVLFNVAVLDNSGNQLTTSVNHSFKFTTGHTNTQVVNHNNSNNMTEISGYDILPANIKLVDAPNLQILQDGNRSYYISSPKPLQSYIYAKHPDNPARLKGYWKTAYYDGVMNTEEVFFVTEYYWYNERKL